MYFQKITLYVQQKRLQRCQQLLRRFETREQIENIWFSNEKLFSLRQPKIPKIIVFRRRLKKRYVSLKNILISRQHFAQSLMVSVAMSVTGKTSVIFVDNDVLRDILLNMLLQIKVCKDYTLQQNSAPWHTSQQSFFRNNVPTLLEENWPPKSPDLNPVDYCVWGLLENMIYYNHTYNSPF